MKCKFFECGDVWVWYFVFLRGLWFFVVPAVFENVIETKALFTFHFVNGLLNDEEYISVVNRN